MNASNLDVQYTASATSTGGRQGEVKTSDGTLSLRTTEPKELGGKGEEGATNPEQLFAAGYASCFSSAAKLAAETMNLPLQENDMQVTCHVSYGKDRSDTGFGLKVKMEVAVNGLEQDAKQRLIEKANEICPYSKAIKGNVEVELVTK
ncbi:organic hydroperoxide resistance protein [Cesiribacter andamanensis]|uniref:General stress protein 17o n=1 Tax=Cesiribacter andamanensis AMV16 TaxID=1279009 RepID=M7N115_9BACT|nr:organic hydroperoxide resistance protein [Cesiribacter andamanensis]EMR00997.1 General stress protein 17o [Cesiribacter andamanensis AMV16]